MSAGVRAGVRLRARVAARDFDVDVTMPGGVCTAVVGPNGAGKSTLLELLSGQLRPDRGSDAVITLAGSRLVDGDSIVPPHRRGVMLLQQRSMLFPHLEVVANVAFGVRSARRRGGQRVSRSAARQIAKTKLADVGCLEFADRRPDQLSGGQQQRVALARALAIDPSLVALDEPLSALDVSVAAEMRAMLAEQLAGRTSLLVTHDLLDVLTLADHLVVLDGGRVVDEGPVGELVGRPRHPFLAEFTGVSVLTGTATPEGVRLADGSIVPAAANDLRGQPCHARIPSSAVRLTDDDSPIGGVVRRVEPRGAAVRVVIDLAGQTIATDVPTLVAAGSRIEPGHRARLTFDPDQISIYA